MGEKSDQRELHGGIVERGASQMREQHRQRPRDPQKPNTQCTQGPVRHLAGKGGGPGARGGAKKELSAPGGQARESEL